MKPIKTFRSINGTLGMYDTCGDYFVTWRWSPSMGSGSSVTTSDRNRADEVYEEIRTAMMEG